MRLHLGTFFSNNVRYEDWNALSFGVYSNSVAQKLSLLAIFDPKNPFLSNLKDDRIKKKLKFNKVAVALASCDHQKSKLCTVAGVERFWVAGLRVRQLKIGRKSCSG